MYLNRDEQVEWYERLARVYDGWAKQAKDDNSKRAWSDKANECWLKARELKGVS